MNRFLAILALALLAAFGAPPAPWPKRFPPKISRLGFLRKTTPPTPGSSARNPLILRRKQPPAAYGTASGRPKWPNRDPIAEAGGNSLYAFVLNNPISFTDFIGAYPTSVETPAAHEVKPKWGKTRPKTWGEAKATPTVSCTCDCDPPPLWKITKCSIKLLLSITINPAAPNPSGTLGHEQRHIVDFINKAKAIAATESRKFSLGSWRKQEDCLAEAAKVGKRIAEQLTNSFETGQHKGDPGASTDAPEATKDYPEIENSPGLPPKPKS